MANRSIPHFNGKRKRTRHRGKRNPIQQTYDTDRKTKHTEIQIKTTKHKHNNTTTNESETQQNAGRINKT